MKLHWKWLALLGALLLVVAACGDSDGEGTVATEGTTPPGTEGTTPPAEGPDLEGAEVSIFGAFSGVEADAVNEVIEEKFNGPTGANAFYEGSDSFEEQIKIRVEGGNPPDIAVYPQPGSVVEQAEAGNAIALEDLGFDIAELEATFGSYLLSLGEFNGKHYGLPTNVNSKSLVWYSIPGFESLGVEPPTTWDEMIAISDQAVEAGVTPWCIGTGSDAATGWPATDWMEDIMLRTAGAEIYDQWVAHEIPFNAPEVVRAGELLGDIVFAEGYVLGSAEQIPAIDFRDAPDPMFNEPPGCLMHRQASFIVNFFPENAVIGENVGVFAFPDIDEGKKGALIAGELAAVFRDAPEVRAFIENFISVDTQCAQGSIEGVQRISPNVNVGADCYGDEVVAVTAAAITDALKIDGARFDASDLMPSAVGSGTFWTAMNDYMKEGPDSLEGILQEVEDSWPAE